MNKIIALLLSILLFSCTNRPKLHTSNNEDKTSASSNAISHEDKSQKSLDKFKKNGILLEENGLSIDCKSTQCSDINTMGVNNSATHHEEKQTTKVPDCLDQTKNPTIVKSHEDFVNNMRDRHSTMCDNLSKKHKKN